MRDSRFLKSLLGEDCATALLDTVHKTPGLEPAVTPRAIVSWLSALGDRYEGSVPGTDGLFKFERLYGLYSGEIKIEENLIKYDKIPGLELAAILSVSLGEDLEPSFAKPNDLQKLGKSLDKMVKAVLSSQEKFAIREYLIKADTVPKIMSKIKLPHKISKVEPKGTTAKPGAATAPASQTNASAPMAPKKQTSTQNPTVTAIPGASKTLKVAKFEASRSCNICGQNRFFSDRFVGCLCYTELAKSITTKVLPDGYLLKTSTDFESFASLAMSIRSGNV